MGARVSACPRVRAEYQQRDGYLMVTIEGVRHATGAHRLVWTNCHGAIPAGLTINHKNGKKADNNSPGNLELATYSEQRRHALDVLKVARHHPVGSRHPKTKLEEPDVVAIRRLRAEGTRVLDIAAVYAMKPRAISAICNRRTWKHI